MSKSKPKKDSKLDIKSVNFSIGPVDSSIKKKTKVAKSSDLFNKRIEDIGNEFVALMLMLFQYMNEVGSVAEHTAKTSFLNLFPFIKELKDIESLEKDSEPLAKVSFKITYDLDNKEQESEIDSLIYREDHIKKIVEFDKKRKASLEILNETAVQQIVNAYESLIGNILEWRLYNKPDSAIDNEKVSYKELLSFGTLEEIKKKVIDDHKTEFLKSKSANDQIKYFKDEFGIDLGSHFPELNEFKELVLRRHTIVHAGGIATTEYISRANAIKGIDVQKIKVGSKIDLTTKYVINAWMVTFALGIILLHQVGRQYARSIRDKELEKIYDNELVGASYDSINDHAYKAAQYILEYARKITLSGDQPKYYISLNLAQTYLWQGKKEKCNEVLDNIDWSCLSPSLQIAEASLRNDEVRFKELLPIIASQQEIKIEDFLNWPIFRLMRKKDRFKDWIQDAYKKEIREYFDLLPENLLDFKNKNIEKLEAFIGKTKNGS